MLKTGSLVAGGMARMQSWLRFRVKVGALVRLRTV